MKKMTIKVPGNVHYLKDYSGIEDQFPQGSFFLDKKLTGCGATTMFLADSVPTILCSARKELMYCKARSPRFKGKVYLFRDEGDTSDVLTLQRNLCQYVKNCMNGPFGYSPKGPYCQVPKIITTYDSFKHVMEQLHTDCIIHMFRIVVDEAQTLFTDSSFKGDVEMEFLENLARCRNVIYLSATQFMEQYLDHIDYFKNLPYVELEWPRSAIEATNIVRSKYDGTPLKTAEKIIEDFRSTGYFAAKIVNGVVYYARQAVFFVNDVSLILKIAKKCNLTASEVNVICADSDANKKRLNALGLSVGHAPQEGEPHKTMTFATKAAFEGVDFYHDSAYTFIFSDATKENLALDISLVLKQCMGRQRLGSNVFRLDATFFYKDDITFDQAAYDEFCRSTIERQTATGELIDAFNHSSPILKKYMASMVRDCQRAIRESSKRDYTYATAVDNKTTGQVDLVHNYLAMLNEIRAWDVQMNQYQNGCQVMKAIDSSVPSIDSSDQLLASFLQNFTGTFEAKLDGYCKFLDNNPTYKGILESLPQIPLVMKQAYNQIGTMNLMLMGYHEAEVLQNIESRTPLQSAVMAAFSPKRFYPLPAVKDILQGVYNRHGIRKTATATDVEKYLPCQKRRRNSPIGGREEGYEIL